jgi:predicted dehydrogenase
MPHEIGIVGAGDIVQMRHLPVLRSMPQVRIAWLFDRDSRRCASVARSHRVTTAAAASARDLPACDVVLLATPVQARRDYLEEFSRRGVAALCEKPFAMGRDDHLRSVDLYPDHKLGCGYMRRFYSSTQLLKQLIEEGWFGPLEALSIREGDRAQRSPVGESFLDDSRLGAARGVLADLGSHTIDLAMFLTRATDFDVLRHDIDRDGNVDRKVTATILLQSQFAAGSQGIEFDYCVSWLDRQPNVITLRFEHCTVWAQTAPEGRVFLGDPRRPTSSILLNSAGDSMAATTYNQAFFLEWMSFLKGMQSEAPSEVSARSALRTTGLVERLLNL